MDRKIRTFKRTLNKDDKYNTKIKEQMDIKNFQYQSHDKKRYDNLILDCIRSYAITKRIIQLPYDTQRRIYIFAMKNYWKNMTLNQPLRPIWCDYKKYLDNQLKRSIIDNVHFMHLEFNTLPENKKWIPGCTCNFCQNYKKNHRNEVDEILNKIVEDEYYFLKMLGCHEPFVNKWNQYETFYGDALNYTRIITYDPLKDMFEDNIEASPHDSPIYFSQELSPS